MSFNLIFILIIISFFEKIKTGDNDTTNMTHKLTKPYSNIQNATTNTKHIRKLDDPTPINIFVDTTILERNLEEYEEEMDAIKKGIEKAKEAIQKIIKIKTKSESINILDYVENFESSVYKDLIKDKYENQSTIIDADLLIFVRGKGNADTMNSFANITKFKTNSEGRVVVGCIKYDYTFDYVNTKDIDYDHRIYLLSILFLHEFIHFLGFDKDILLSKKLIESQTIESRIKNGFYTKKYAVTNKNVLNFAQKYFGTNVPYIEFSEESENEDLPNSHWEGRLLLGDIMTLNLYYPEQVISEFTLLLLEQLGWYEINYYTGGLMKYGKGQGSNFFNNDCIDISKDAISFPNEFCLHSFGTCSFGRQTRSYCGNKEEIKSADYSEYNRNSYTKGYGLEMVEYCPVSIEISKEEYSNYYYIGNCNIGNEKYGTLLTFLDGKPNYKYGDFNGAFKEEIGNNSFCALSSIIKKDDDNYNKNLYEKLIRPTCYEMSCSEKSLTIKIDSEYIVCPRLGGMVKIEGNYVGYLFCPDYNLICTGTVLCNNIFDCIDKESIYKESSFSTDYYKESISYNSELEINNENNISKYYSVSDNNYELSEDGKCPVDCMQCLSNKRCILCGNSKNYYIGEKDDSSSHINCTDEAPTSGYYKKGDDHFFRCIEGCDVCENANSCSRCFPEFYLSDDKTECIERIPHCIKYNESATFEDKDGNTGYQTCLQCDNDNNYYCVNMNKSECKLVNNRENYYALENTDYPCIRNCNDDFPNCITCNINTCIYCDARFYFNDTHDCVERIPNCEVYDEDSIYKDVATNNGGDGYSECENCSDNYYCIQDNKAICQKIDSLIGYYDYGNGCKDTCENKFTFVCLECIFDKCTNCQTRLKTDEIHCVEGINNCIKYDKDNGNDTYIECLKCDEENNYICIKNNRTFCKNVNKSLYYKLEPDYQYSCYNKCDDKFIGCETCDSSGNKCTQCKNKFTMDMTTNECFLNSVPMSDDYCRVETHEINDEIGQIDFDKLIEYYYDNIYSYLNTVIHYVNKDYTMILFINSDCTESLLEQGYYKIDSKELNTVITDEIGLNLQRHEFLFHFFIEYKNKNHYRVYNFNSKYVAPNIECTTCVNTPFILTNKYNNTISIALGPILSSTIVLEKIDIFSKDSEIYTDLCQNLTLEGVDMPLNDRLHYLYLGEHSTQVACGGDNCELVETNKEESTSVCKCKLNEYEDLFKEVEITNSEEQESQSSSSDSFGIIKCTKNGFNANNIKANGGFYICLIAIIGVGALILVYFLCSKIITTSEKGSNPPPKLKNRLRIVSNWDKTEEERKKMKKYGEEVMNDFQPLDGREDELYEEEKDYSYIYYDMSNSFDTALMEKKFNNSGRGEKARKILVLLPGAKKNKDEEDNFSSSESSPLGDSSKKKKKTFCQIYWHVLSLKQHIINFFSFCTCLDITESYIPLPIRIIRSLFLIVTSFLLSILFLNQKYYSKKFKYFNEKYKLISGTTDGVTITPEEVVGGVPSGELWKYSFIHTFANGIIVFALLLVVQFIIGVGFFSLRNRVIEVLKKNDTSGINELVAQTRIRYLIFFIITVILMILFLFVFIAFGGAYGGGFSDYFLPGIIALIFLQIFPFLWSLIISLLHYIGIKQKSKCCRQVSRFFMF